MALSIDVPLPRSGAPTRLELGGLQWFFERTPNGVRGLALGAEPRWKGWLGLPEGEGQLRLSIRCPGWPLELGFEDEILLAPGGRLRAWVRFPVEQRVELVQGGECLELFRLPEEGLRTAWGENGGYFHPWKASLRVGTRPDPRHGGPGLWCRIFLANQGGRTARVETLRLDAGEGGLREMGGLYLLAPLRWVFGAAGGPQRRAWEGVSAQRQNIGAQRGRKERS